MVRHPGSNNSIQADPTDEVMRIGKIKDTYGTFNASTSTARQFSYGISGSMATTASFGLIEGGMIKGNGSLITNLTSAAIDGVSNMANNRVITAVDGTTVNAEANLVFTGTKLGIGTDSPLNLLQIDGSGADGANGISIVRSDSSTAADDLLGGISFDSTDGNAPSSILQGSAYIAAYASEDHSTGDKGGYLTFGTAPDDQNDDTTSTERVRIHNGGTLEVLTGNISGSATSTGSFGHLDIASGKIKFHADGDMEINGTDPVQNIDFGANRPQASYFTINSTNDTKFQLQETEAVIVELSKTKISGSSSSTGSFGHGHFANKLGVGTQSPTDALDLRGGGINMVGAANASSIQMAGSDGTVDGYVYAQTGEIGFLDAGGDWGIQYKNDTHIKFNLSGASTKMTILNSGNVGIGTDSPDKDLHIHQGNSNSLFEAITIRTNSTGEGLCLGINADNSSYIYNSAAGNEGLRLSGISSARDTGHVFISGSGDVGIGKTPSVALEVAGTISGSLINSSGDVVAFNASDERLKDNIEIIKEPIEKIQQLRGVEYQWNGLQNTYPSGSLDSGIIAQDVQKVLPQLVKERGDGYLGVRQERLVGLLVESIKDQQEQINELKLQIKEIKDGSS